MSAFVHGTDHIDLIVTAAFRSLDRITASFTYWHPATKELHQITDPTELGRLLIAENVRSMVTRYEYMGEDELARYAELVNTYTHRPVQDFQYMPNHWPAALHACMSLAAQSCETHDWHETHAAGALERIRENITVRLIRETGVNAWCWTRESAQQRTA